MRTLTRAGSVVGLLWAIALTGCVSSGITEAIDQYHEASSKVQLGDSKDQVLSVLLPTQAGIVASQRRPPESFLKDGVQTDINYVRTGGFVYEPGNPRRPIVTDDLFTPYVFTDGKLTSIGWTALGGPKTVYTPASSKPDTVINNTSLPTTTNYTKDMTGNMHCFSF
jgi:hypothetical protein